MVLTNTFLQSSFLAEIWRDLSAFSTNAGKYGPEKTPYLDNFHAVTGNARKRYSQEQLIRNEISKYQKILASMVLYEGKS